MFLQPEPDKSDLQVSASATDGELWEAFKRGDVAAFSRIYHQLVQDLYNYGLKISAHPETVEDCIQDLFIYIWDNRKQLGRTDNIKFYLFKALKRRLLVKTAEKQRKVSWLKADAGGEAADASSEALLIALQSEQDQSARLEKALQSLTSRQREAISLRFYDKLSYAEIANIMSLTIQSAYSLIARAMEVLREQLRLVHLLVLLLF